MPRYFFDVRDQQSVVYDEIGIELADIDAARREAWRALAEMMQEEISRAGKAVVAIDIRTGSGQFVVEVVAASDDRDLS
jgi:hypothetical protein